MSGKWNSHEVNFVDQGDFTAEVLAMDCLVGAAKYVVFHIQISYFITPHASHFFVIVILSFIKQCWSLAVVPTD